MLTFKYKKLEFDKNFLQRYVAIPRTLPKNWACMYLFELIFYGKCKYQNNYLEL